MTAERRVVIDGARCGWFRIRRAAGRPGVNLVTRIPGYLEQVTPHLSQAAAEQAARDIYSQYQDAVRALASSDQSED